MQNAKSWSLDLGGRELRISTGLLAGQANGAVTVAYGETVVLGTAVMSKHAGQSRGYFPLMVDYEERYYAAGKIKGSRFIKREGRPSDTAVLSGRAVDRTVRPLFDGRMRSEIQVVTTVLSFDGENDPDLVAIIAASAALAISDIPWNGPVGAVRVGRIAGGDFILNPTTEERENETNTLDLMISGTKDKINMIEAGANEISEAEMAKAFEFGFANIQKIALFIESICSEIGRPKSEAIILAGPEGFDETLKAFLREAGLAEALFSLVKKEEKEVAFSDIEKKMKAFVSEKYPETAAGLGEVASLVMDELSDEILHEKILKENMRPDGRKLDEIRPITSQVGVLPRTHGTGLFTRGETQALTVTTLGAPGDQMIVDTMEVDMKKRYMHFYNFPPYSVGEVKPMRGPGRREIGHGALAEKALLPVLPLFMLLLENRIEISHTCSLYMFPDAISIPQSAMKKSGLSPATSFHPS